MVNFWVRKGNTLDAPLTLVEDVLEDSHSEIQKETSLHVEDENMSDDRKEKEKEEEIAEKEKKVKISEERLDISNEEKEDVAKMFNSTKKHYIPVWCPPVLAVLAVLYIVYGSIVYVFINVLSYCLYLF